MAQRRRYAGYLGIVLVAAALYAQAQGLTVTGVSVTALSFGSTTIMALLLIAAAFLLVYSWGSPKPRRRHRE